MDKAQPTVSTDIDKVLDSSNARIFQVRSIVRLFDAPQRPFLETGVPVLDSEGKTIGFASVFSEGTAWVADLAFDYSTPERLAAEMRSERMYAHLKIDETGSMSLEISLKRPVDDRLEPLGTVQL